MEQDRKEEKKQVNTVIRKTNQPLEVDKPNKVMVKVIKLDERAIIPVQKHEGDAGFDLTALEEITLPPHEQEMISTGLQFIIPKGFVGIIKGRSGLALAGLHVLGGVIDQSFEGETKIILLNTSKIQKHQILSGERAAQILFIPVLQGILQEVKEHHGISTRGTQGFGSTGVNAISHKKITNLEDGRGQETKTAYKIGENLDEKQQDHIHRLCKKFENIMATSFEEIKGTTPFFHDVDTGDSKPIKQRPYVVPVKYKAWVEKEIKVLLDSGLI